MTQPSTPHNKTNKRETGRCLSIFASICVSPEHASQCLHNAPYAVPTPHRSLPMGQQHHYPPARLHSHPSSFLPPPTPFTISAPRAAVRHPRRLIVMMVMAALVVPVPPSTVAVVVPVAPPTFAVIVLIPFTTFCSPRPHGGPRVAVPFKAASPARRFQVLCPLVSGLRGRLRSDYG